MVVLDEKIDLERVEQFASQVKFLPKTLKADIAQNFSEDQGPDFYQGLLAAYANAYVICSASNPQSQETQTLGAIVAYLADQILTNEWY